MHMLFLCLLKYQPGLEQRPFSLTLHCPGSAQPQAAGGPTQAWLCKSFPLSQGGTLSEGAPPRWVLLLREAGTKALPAEGPSFHSS